MFVILKNTNEIYDIIYSNNESLAYNSMTNHAVQEMESLKMSPALKNTKYITYYINSTERTVELMKKYKLIYKGMIYNSSEYITETVFKMTFLPFNNYNSVNSIEPTSDFNFNLNKEIHTRLFKQLDTEQATEVFNKLLGSFCSKKTWNNHEIMNLITDITYEYKTNKISDIIQNMKRYGEYPLPYFKESKTRNESQLPYINTIPTSSIDWNNSKITSFFDNNSTNWFTTSLTDSTR